jgi:hypothetical protein
MKDIVIFKDLTTEEKIQEIELQSEQYKGLVVDMNKPAERKKVKESAEFVKGLLKKIDRKRIDTKKEYAAQVEEEAALITGRLEVAIEPLTDLIEAHKEQERLKREKEKARQEEIDNAFSRMNDVALEAIGQTATVIESIIDELGSYDFNPDTFQERTEEAVKKHSKLMQQLDMMLKQAQAQEEMEARAAEIERKEREQAEKEEAERLRIEREKIAQEAAEKARIKAEQRHAQEMIKAEQRRIREAEEAKQREIDAEKRAKEQAEAAARAERDRIEAEKLAEEAEERKRQENKRHKGKIHSDIVSRLVSGGLAESDAKKAVELIAKGLAGNVRIYY